MSRQRKQVQHNALSFDLEHWHSATLVRDAVSNPEDHIEQSLEIVLERLEARDVRATFFIVGELAKKFPDLVARIRDGGHELGSHGHTHTPLGELTPSEFRRELCRSRDAIAEAAGVEPVGFRAPNFSLTRETEWAMDVLADSEYRYDTSVFPVRTPLYGVEDAPVAPYPIRSDAPFQSPASDSQDGELVEFPLAVLDSAVRLPVAGGFYARVLPISVLRYGIRRLNGCGIPTNLYFHPWEFNPAVKTNEVPIHKRFVSFHGIEGLERKLDSLLASFPFAAVSDVLAERGLGVDGSDQPAEPTRTEVLR